jgi:membrane-associated phospholipid phosphatase
MFICADSAGMEAAMNVEFIKFVQSFSNPFLDTFFETVNFLGEDYFAFVVLALLYWIGNKDVAIKVIAAFFLNAMSNAVLKDIFRIPRPGQYADIHVSGNLDGYSFPSGHVHGISSLAIGVAGYFKNAVVNSICILTVILVLLARVYLGAHTIVDGIGAVAAALVFFCLSNLLLSLLEKKEKVLKGLFVAVIALMFIGLAFFQNLTYYAGFGGYIGSLFGHITGQRYVNYQRCKTIKGTAIACAAGMLTLIVISTLLMLCLPEAYYSYLIIYMISGAYITLFHPMAIKAVSAKFSQK